MSRGNLAVGEPSSYPIASVYPPFVGYLQPGAPVILAVTHCSCPTRDTSRASGHSFSPHHLPQTSKEEFQSKLNHARIASVGYNPKG